LNSSIKIGPNFFFMLSAKSSALTIVMQQTFPCFSQVIMASLSHARAVMPKYV